MFFVFLLYILYTTCIEVITLLATSDDSPQSFPASLTPEIQPQLNGEKDNSTVTHIQSPSGMVYSSM